jgi:hypothetical protein
VPFDGSKTWRNAIAFAIASGAPYHSRPNGSASEIRSTPRYFRASSSTPIADIETSAGITPISV